MTTRRPVFASSSCRTMTLSFLLAGFLTSGAFVPESRADKAADLFRELQAADILKQPEIVRELEALGIEAVPSLIDVLDSDKPAERHQAIEILGRIGPSANAATPLLIDALDDAEAQIRRNAAWALGRVGGGASAAMPTLLDTAKDIQWDVRADAVWAMGRVVEDGGELGVVDAELVDVVTEFLDDHSHHVRWSAAWSLARFGPSADASLDSLLTTLEDEHPKVRASAATALGHIAQSHHEDKVGPALEKAMQDESALVRTRAKAALNAMRGRTAPSF